MTVRKAVSDVGTMLLHATVTGATAPATGYAKLVGVKATPAKGSAPEQLDVTELHDEQTSFIAGRKSIETLEYTFNWTKANATSLTAVEGKRHAFLEKLGEEGDGFLIIGQLSYAHNGVSLNSAQEGTIWIVPESVEYIADVSTYSA